MENEDFGDLFLNDFILAQKRVARRSMGSIVMCSNLKALLERGVQHQMDEAEGRSPLQAVVETCIGYAGAVGVGLADHMKDLTQAVSVIELILIWFGADGLSVDGQDGGRLPGVVREAEGGSCSYR